MTGKHLELVVYGLLCAGIVVLAALGIDAYELVEWMMGG